MKKIFFITISILLLFSIFATFNNTVYASSLTTEKTLFSGLDDSSIMMLIKFVLFIVMMINYQAQ